MGQLWGVRAGGGQAWEKKWGELAHRQRAQGLSRPPAQGLWTRWGETWEVAQHHGHGLASGVT